MFQERADDADHPNVFTQPFATGIEAAHAANDQFDRHSGLGRFIKKRNDRWIHKRIHLRSDHSLSALLSMFNFAADQQLHAFPQGDGGHEQATKTLLLRKTGEVIKQFHQVLPQFLVGCE